LRKDAIQNASESDPNAGTGCAHSVHTYRHSA
jgi:hypothetical protein